MTKSTSALRRGPAWFALIALVFGLLLASCSSGVSGSGSTANPTAAGTGATDGQEPSAPAEPTDPATTSGPPPKVVHVSSLQADGATYGVGMPIVLKFSPAPTDSTEFTKAVTVTVDGEPVNGAWFWEKPYADQPIQAHYRLRNFWPANSEIQVQLPIEGLSAGKGLVYDGALTSITFNIGDEHVSTVNAAALTMEMRSNGKLVKSFPVSLGAAQTPTYNGTKIVMQKGEQDPATSKLRPNGAVIMQGPGYGPELVDWSVRITASGEYVHAAPWNSRIGRLSTSNGCTNLSVADAKWYYDFAQVGDVVTYTGTSGTKMPSWDGYGDWNVPWQLWKQGGLLINH